MAGTNGQDTDPYSRRVLDLLRQLRRAERERLTAARGTPERRIAETRVEEIEAALREAALAVLPPRRAN
jgi:hypothetical protein